MRISEVKSANCYSFNKKFLAGAVIDAYCQKLRYTQELLVGS